MAWIESHQELRHHYKTKRLARELKVTVAAAVGHLHFLWWWAVEFAPDGDLTKFDDYEIADAIGYNGKDPSKARAALISAGFLDNSECGALTIHDWHEYARRTLAQREKAKERVRQQRKKQAANVTPNVSERQQTKSTSENITDAQQNSNWSETYSNVTHNVRVTYENSSDNVSECCAPTEQYITKHNITEHDKTKHDSTEIPPSSPESGGTGAGMQAGSDTDGRFDAFWKIYPKKQGKGAAVKAWKKIRPDRQLFETILKSVQDNVNRNQQWKRDNGQYIPNPSTWLNQQRWLDEIPGQQTGGAADGTGNSGGSIRQRTGGADGYHDFRPSTGFRSADSIPDSDS